MHVYFWPGKTVAISGLQTRVKSARLFASKRAMNFEQDRFRVRFTGLPTDAPDQPVTTLEMECEGEPVQNTEFVRRERSRADI
jgi:alpha-L-fucosidase